MHLEFVPLLTVQRKLYAMPRGMERFKEYLRVMLNDERDALRLPPLVIMNPMGRDHVTALLDALIAMDADGLAARAVEHAAARLSGVPGESKIGLTIADDAMGGWTNRYATEFGLRFASGPILNLKRGWLSAVLWSSEPADPQRVREAALTSVYRAAHLQEHGVAATLSDMLRQEGSVMALAGCTWPALEADDIAYTREVIAPHLGARDKRAAIECLFGDAAARSLGFTPRGLSPWAGLALALHDARKSERPSHSLFDQPQ